MSYIMVDIEADGPIPGDYSMISIGAVVVNRKLDKGFLGTLKPISDKWVPEALAVSGFSREQTLEFDDAKATMLKFDKWVRENNIQGKPMFISDNAGFDWMFSHWYMVHFLGTDLFGFSSTSLTSLYKGCRCNMRESFKHLRKTKHTHNPLQDAIGNAEALITISDQFKLGIV
jgi:hypothetical protein